MNFIDQVIPAFDRLRSRSGSDPIPIDRMHGARFARLSDDTIRVLSGALAGKELRLVEESAESEYVLRLVSKGVVLGFAAFELVPGRNEAVLWNVVLDPDWRNQGLGSVLVCAALRQLVEKVRPVAFSIRMLQLFSADDGTIRLQNLGLGVIVRKLGFTPAPMVLRLLCPENIERADLLQEDLRQPPFYRVMLRGFPPVMVALPVAPDNWHPYGRGSPFFSLRSVSPGVIADWARSPYVIFGNCDYILRRGGIPALAAGIAAHAGEAEALVRRIRPVRVSVRRHLLGH